MPYLQSQPCPKCSTTNRVCLKTDEIPSSDDRYRYTCHCGEVVEFSPEAGTKVDECPDYFPIATMA